MWLKVNLGRVRFWVGVSIVHVHVHGYMYVTHLLHQQPQRALRLEEADEHVFPRDLDAPRAQVNINVELHPFGLGGEVEIQHGVVERNAPSQRAESFFWPAQLESIQRLGPARIRVVNRVALPLFRPAYAVERAIPLVVEAEDGLASAPYGRVPGCILCVFSVFFLLFTQTRRAPLDAQKPCFKQVGALVRVVVEHLHGARVPAPHVPQQPRAPQVVIQHLAVNGIAEPAAHEPPVEHVVDGHVLDNLQQQLGGELYRCWCCRPG